CPNHSGIQTHRLIIDIGNHIMYFDVHKRAEVDTRITVDDDSNIILIMSYDILHDPIEDRIEETSCSIPSLLSFLNSARLQFCIEIGQLITEKLHRIEIANVNFIAPKLTR